MTARKGAIKSSTLTMRISDRVRALLEFEAVTRGESLSETAVALIEAGRVWVALQNQLIENDELRRGDGRSERV